MAVFIGTPGNDNEVGGSWLAMSGGDGNDRLNDTVDNPAGDDEDDIDGGLGHDLLYFSGTAAGLIYASSGNDTVKGFAGADNLHGDDGDDVVFGGDGDDSIEGGHGR